MMTETALTLCFAPVTSYPWRLRPLCPALPPTSSVPPWPLLQHDSNCYGAAPSPAPRTTVGADGTTLTLLLRARHDTTWVPLARCSAPHPAACAPL